MVFRDIFQAFSNPDIYYVSDGVTRVITSREALENARFSGVPIRPVVDSRLARDGDIFFALVGVRVDGHNFVLDAVRRGARIVVAHRSRIPTLKKSFEKKRRHSALLIGVDSPKRALIDCACYARDQLSKVTFVAITGSVGKTTTKAMLEEILDEHGEPYFVAHKNQNTQIGISLNMLQVSKNTKIAVFECGINAPGEMGGLVSIVRPTHAAITGASPAHVEGLGDTEHVAREKRKIFTCAGVLKSAIVPLLQRDILTKGVAESIVKTCSTRDDRADVSARDITATCDDVGGHTLFFLTLDGRQVKARLATPNYFFVENALIAAALARECGLAVNVIVRGLKRFKPVEGRFELVPLREGCGRLINDCYNAVPQSMQSSLQVFGALSFAGKKVAVLGDMLELGDSVEYFHTAIGVLLKQIRSIDVVVAIGPGMKYTAKAAGEGSSIVYFESLTNEVYSFLDELAHDSTLFFLKASNGMNFCKIVQHLS